MINDRRGAAHAVHVLYECLKNYETAFAAVIAEAQAQAPEEWGSFRPASIMPVLFRMDDGPYNVKQPKSPSLVMTLEDINRDGDTRAIEVEYTFSLCYVYSCPEVGGFQDAPFIACQLAHEAIVRCLHEYAPRGIGLDFKTAEISALLSAQETIPNWSRILTIPLTIQVQEGY